MRDSLSSLTRLAGLAASALAIAMPGTAFAQSCVSENVYDRLKTEDPALYAEIAAEAAATPNTESLFWRIEAEGVAPSYLFGTLHVADERVLDLPAPVENAFETIDTLAVEVVNADDPQLLGQLMASNPGLLVALDGTTITSRLEANEAAALENALAARGVPLASIEPLQPWIVTTMLATSACEFALQAGGATPLDGVLEKRALNTGKTVIGLETMQDQLEAITGISEEFFVASLADLAELSAQGDLDALQDTITALYLSGDIGVVLPLTVAFSAESAAIDGEMAEFEEKLITVRNEGMAESAAPLIDKGNAFIAVGALHLPGETGLVRHFRERGYTVTPIPIPR
ncbi:TraB/GumN family protein [Cucumibacter marinus]|uniref:TraB/GumN family protein n=1 Tax=Cucumibacter marinus TaxID=1121252 RepID=UPI0003F9678D|nr:TraB/GumN family protein [Cucumibacter marinus]